MPEYQEIEIPEETRRKLKRLNFSEENYRELTRRLGEEPDDLTLAIVAAMWSEHCSYGYSRLPLQKYFGTLEMPPYALRLANAGAVNLGAAAAYLERKGGT